MGRSRDGEPKLMEAIAMATAGIFDLTTFICLFLIKETSPRPLGKQDAFQSPKERKNQMSR